MSSSTQGLINDAEKNHARKRNGLYHQLSYPNPDPSRETRVKSDDPPCNLHVKKGSLEKKGRRLCCVDMESLDDVGKKSVRS